jgi:hypothetical protein
MAKKIYVIVDLETFIKHYINHPVVKLINTSFTINDMITYIIDEDIEDNSEVMSYITKTRINKKINHDILIEFYDEFFHVLLKNLEYVIPKGISISKMRTIYWLNHYSLIVSTCVE